MDVSVFAKLSPTTFADVLSRDRVMDHGIRPLWQPMPRLVGVAYPVGCPAGDNLMLHVALHRAPPGSVLVVQAGDCNWAMAGGNVCAYAQERGIAGLVVDGVVRDLAEIRENRFPVFARGVLPIPAPRRKLGTLDAPIDCGSVRVEPGDIVVADEEGVVVVRRAEAEEVLRKAEARAASEAALTLDAWASEHQAKIDAVLKSLGVS
ncbi:RraA family protein [Chondromyces crocatus]|uniref:Putative 4-hydroxy-4-methyl-2-oxoglutarate aldolase n=1 Tax=Chondromyces crocatus TaxID=52 RepID=A0A0K1ELJ1_CHOCO|nr:RraA family protein [Chondromyces crocatus]AKT41542.1 diguanylate cyclase [Chondromyces crocatus]